MKVIDLNSHMRQIIALCVGLVLSVICWFVSPGLLVGVVVGFGAGSYCYKRYPQKYQLFRLPENKTKAKIRELERINGELADELKKSRRNAELEVKKK